MSKLTKDKIGKLLNSQTIGNFSSLASLHGKENLNLNKFKIPSEDVGNKKQEENDMYEKSYIDPKKNNYNTTALLSKNVLNTFDNNFSEEKFETLNDFNKNNSNEAPLTEKNNEFIRPNDKKNAFKTGSETKNSKQINVTNEFSDVSSFLGGKGFSLVMYLIRICQQNCSLITPPVFTKDLLQVVNIKPNHLRNLILRLKEQKVFKVLLYKGSNNAIRVFEFDKHNYDFFIKKINTFENNNLTYNILNKEPYTNIEEENQNKSIHRFEGIDLSSLENIGFDETHLIQIHKEYEKNPDKALPMEILQNSIDAFSFDLKHNHITEGFKNSPAVVLLSLLKKGIPYSSKTPEKVLSPKEAAMKEYLLSQEQKNLKIMETETKAMEIAKKEWLSLLSEEELLDFNEGGNICPPGMHEKLYQISRRQQALANAKKYFDNVIWPKKLKEILEKSV